MKKTITLFFLITFALTNAQFLRTIPSNGGAPVQSRVVTDWLHYDGDNASNVGNSNSHTAGVYVKLTSNLLTPHVGRQIEELQFYIGDLSIISSNIEIKFYSDLNASPIYTQTLDNTTLTSNAWNTVTLTTPYQITSSQDLYVGYYYTTTGGFFAGIDDGSNFVNDVNYVIFNGTLYEFGSIGLTNNLNIRAGVGGATSANDAGVSSIDIDDAIEVGSVQITGSIINYGSNTLNSIDISYQIDSNTPVTETFSGLNLASGSTYNYTFSTPWNATSGNHTITVSVSNFNGNGADDISSNDTLNKTVMVVNEIFPQTVLYEEGTGTWCGWCVRGIVGLKDMAHYHDDGSWIGIAVHNGDPMVVSEYDNGLGINSFPGGRINRGQSDVDPGLSSLENAYQATIQNVPLAKINIINQSYDAASREISVEVETKFALDLHNANFNLGLIIVENNVTGTSSGYAQHNYYHTNGIDIIDWEGINYRNLPDPIPATDIAYNHVGRALVGGFNGVSGVLPGNVTYNTPFHYTFTYTLPANFDENEIELVAVVINQSENGKIENSTSQHLYMPGAINSELIKNVNIYPNPASDNLQITGADNMAIEITNIAGAIVFKKIKLSVNENIDISNLSDGVYLLKFSKDDKIGIKKIIISK